VLRNIKYSRVQILIITWIFILFSAATAIAGHVTLSWSPPLTNEDGTTLNDLAGYKIYYGTSSGDYIHSIDAGNEITYQINYLQERLTYYFTVTAYDTSGNESICSNEVARYIVQSPLEGFPSTGQTCEGICGIQSQNGCWCDDQCKLYGDCCPDYEPLCLTPQPGDSCYTGKLYDCVLNCVDAADAASRNGDFTCDDGTGGIDLRCSEFNNDGGDCSGGGGLDSNGNGIDDAPENNERVAHPGQGDRDGDGIGDARDNCLAIANPDQADSDLNNIGDACNSGHASNYVCSGTGADCPDYIYVYADLYQCDLSAADLFVADLSFACLHGAVLTNANLHGASLMYADLSNADMSGAYLRSADLTGANLNGADLTGAVLDNVIWWNTYCPDGTNSSNNGNTCAGHLF